jgi:hypothetical protein
MNEAPSHLMRGFPLAEGHRLLPFEVYRSQSTTHWFMQHVREVLGTADLGGPRSGHDVSDLPQNSRDLAGMLVNSSVASRATSLEAVLDATDTDGFLVLSHGALVYEKYFNGMTPETPHMWQSVSKSLVSCVVGNLAEDGRIDLDGTVATYVPELCDSAYGDARVRHLLDMQVGIDYSEDLDDLDSQVVELDRIYGVRPGRKPTHPGSSYDFAKTTHKRGEHGGGFDYVSLNVNVLAWVMERISGTWLPELIRREVWGKLGAEHDAYVALDRAGSAQAESGVCSSLRDLARLGLALLHGGRLNGCQVVSAPWVDEIMGGGDREAFARRNGGGALPDGSYKNNFWVARFGADAAFMGLGIYGQLLYVNPAADLVAAKFSTQRQADAADCFALEFRLCEDLAQVL